MRRAVSFIPKLSLRQAVLSAFAGLTDRSQVSFCRLSMDLLLFPIQGENPFCRHHAAMNRTAFRRNKTARLNWLALASACLFILVGCSGLPRTISRAPLGDPQLADVRRDVSTYQNATVRWGGIIVSVENEAEATWIQILQKRLKRNGRPRDEQRTEGRFLVRIEKFLDPAIFAEGKTLTVFGEVGEQTQRMVGKHTLTLPLVHGREYHLWEDYDRPPGYPYPYFYDDYSPFDFYDAYYW